jgi:hypothetical protein
MPTITFAWGVELLKMSSAHSNPIVQGHYLKNIPILDPKQIDGKLDPIIVASTLF